LIKLKENLNNYQKFIIQIIIKVKIINFMIFKRLLKH